MERKNLQGIMIKWFVLVTLFSLSLVVEKILASRVYLYNSQPYPVILSTYNNAYGHCLKKELGPQSQSFIDDDAHVSTCVGPIEKIDVHHPDGTYIGTINGKDLLYNRDIVI